MTTALFFEFDKGANWESWIGIKSVNDGMFAAANDEVRLSGGASRADKCVDRSQHSQRDINDWSKERAHNGMMMK